MTSDRHPAPPRSTAGAREGVGSQPWRGDVAAGVAAWAGRAGVPLAPPPPDSAAAEPEADHEAVARSILLDQLAGRARSRAELKAKLASRGVPEELAEQLLDRFTAVGLVDDAGFARAWVDSRRRTRGLAPRALAQELRRKGVSDDDARAALAEVTPEDQEQAARALVRKKLRSLRGVDSATAARRLSGLLARKGYPSGLAFAVVRSELESVGFEGEPD